MSSPAEDPEVIFADVLTTLGGSPVVPDDELIPYGPLRLSVPPKEGKANLLLADQLFSPALFLAEKIETLQINVHGKRVIELGAGCGLPSLLMCTLANPPSLVVLTDYPDNLILSNLKNNVERNRHLVTAPCILEWAGYEWGTGTKQLTEMIGSNGGVGHYDVVVLSDLLHFGTSHGHLIDSITSLLSKRHDSVVYVCAGNYTKPGVCDGFLADAGAAGLEIEELTPTETGETTSWLGTSGACNLDSEQLIVRKNNCRFWKGKWS